LAYFIGGIAAVGYFIEKWKQWKQRNKPNIISKMVSDLDELKKSQQALEKSIKPMNSPSAIPVTDFLDGLPQLNDIRKKEIFETGMKLRDENKPMEAIKRFRFLLSSNPLDEQRSALLILIGNSFILTGNQDEALGHYKEALKVADKANNSGAKGVALNNIGLIYGAKGEPDEARKCFQQAWEIFREMGYKQGEANQLGNIRQTYSAKGLLFEEERFRREMRELERLG